MRQLIVNTFLTLDGVMQAPGGPDEDRDGGLEHGGWSVNYWDQRMGEIMDGFMGKPFDLLLGRRTYEIFAAHWPHASEEMGAGPLNRATKHVVSTTLRNLDWGPSVLISDNVVENIRRLKEAEGPELQVHGSSKLVQTLIANNLVDRYGIWTFPVLLGTGKRLFGDGIIPGSLKLVDSQTSTTGVTIATYEPAGAIEYGSFALDQG